MIHWSELLTERDLRVYRLRGHRKTSDPGSNPALLVVDVNHYFLGDRPRPILDSIEEWPQSCGLEGWESLPAISRLLEACRNNGHPVVYTTGDPRKPEHEPRPSKPNLVIGSDIPQQIAPKSGDRVLVKEMPSAFFGTPLLTHLIRNQTDTVLVVGCTTSGCVRATVVDAVSLSFRVIVVEDATFDRTQVSHAVNLFDMHAKYAQVIDMEQSLAYLNAPEDYRPVEIAFQERKEN